MGYLGLVKLGANLTFYCNIHTPATGAAVDADAAPGYRVYEDETAAPLLTGSLALLDDANTTGFYSEQIAVSSANGFEAGKSYCVRITGVVGGVTGVELHQFGVTAKVVDDLNDAAAAPDAATIRTEIDDHSTQLAAILADTDEVQAELANGGRTDLLIDALALDYEAIADEIWDEAEDDHIAVGSMGKTLHDAGAAGDPWAATSRTLTQTAAEIISALSGSTLTIQRGDTLSIPLTGLGNITDRAKLWFTVKINQNYPDDKALIQIEETAGLLYIYSGGPTAGNGTITINDATAGDITITLAALETAKLPLMGSNSLYYDVQMKTSSGTVRTLTSGRASVVADVTRTT